MRRSKPFAAATARFTHTEIVANDATIPDVNDAVFAPDKGESVDHDTTGLAAKRGEGASDRETT